MTIAMRLMCACTLVAVAAAPGCAQPQRALPVVPKELTDEAQVPGMKDIRGWGDGYSPVIEASIKNALRQRRAAGLPLKEVNVLAVSGGGADGAYGAGILCGWSKAGSRPAFDAVTGISTGALIAPFAFLGPAYDKQLQEFYTTITTKDILSRRHLLAALTSDAAADSSPLMRMLTRAVTPDMLKAVAAEHAKGRRLFIGTTNLDAQRTVVWDMGAIAASGRPQSLTLFREVMLASASIPAAFPPRYIAVAAGGKQYYEMHVDGGTTTQVFHFGQMLDYEKMWAQLDVPQNIPRRVFVIRNGLVRPEWQDVPPRFVPIAGRAVTTLLKANAAGDLYRIYAMAKFEGIDFNLTYIPDDHVSKAKEAFDKEEMKSLFDLGFQAARSGTAWKKTPPGVVTTYEQTPQTGPAVPR